MIVENVTGGLSGESQHSIPFFRGGHRVPRTIDFSLGKKNSGYSADIFSKEVYENTRDDLAEAAIKIATQVGIWSPEVVREIVVRGMNTITKGRVTGEVEAASMIFFRRSNDPIGKWIGFSWQELDVNRVGGKDQKDLYLRFRVFGARHRGYSLGRAGIQLALNTHDEAVWIIHRTGSPIAAWSFMRTGVTDERPSGIFKPERRFPWETRYDANPQKDPGPQQLLLSTHFRIRTLGRGINMSTGVTIKDYLEGNRLSSPNPNHAPTVEIERIMREDFGMVFARGDSLIAMGELA